MDGMKRERLGGNPKMHIAREENTPDFKRRVEERYATRPSIEELKRNRQELRRRNE